MAKVQVKSDLKKAERIEKLNAELEKMYGEGTVMGAQDKPKTHEHISTGSLGLDKALGIGGLPKGRIVEVQGWESSGKTSLCLHTIAEAHKDPASWCAFIDVEHAFDAKYAESIGVDLNRLMISQPSYGEQALEITEKYAESGGFDVVVVDSVAALVPKAEVDREMGESSMGKQALLMSQAMRKLTPVVAKTKTLMIFINQMRVKIGVMFGDSSTTPGGNALKFYASVRLVVSRSTTAVNSVIVNDLKMGNLTKVKVIKNKTAPPFRECEFNILFGVGIDELGELLDMAVETGIVTKAGTFFNYGEEKMGQGRINAVDFLSKQEGIYNEIRSKLMDTYIPKEFEATDKDIT